MNDAQWAELVRRVLREAGGEHTLLTGARLKQGIVEACQDQHAFDSYLLIKGLRFVTFLEQVDGVEVRKQVGTDMLVGLEGARWPTTASSHSPIQPELRHDVYEALTRVSRVSFHYLPSTDEFRTVSDGHSDAVALPQVNFEELVAQRRKFAESLDDSSARQALLESLSTSANPLGNFQRELIRMELSDSWHRFKFDLLYAKLSEWASANGIAVSPAWHNNSIEPKSETPQQILTRLAHYMSEQEIGELNVPFRAVEAFYRDLTKRPRA